MKPSRTLSKNLLCTICATILLSGCSYFDIGDEEVNVQAASSESVDLMGPRAPVQDVDVMSMVNQSSDPSVQVFSLDGAPGPDKFSARNVSPAPSRSVISSDPSVEVFPLDDAMRSATPSSLLPSGERFAPDGGQAPIAPVESAPAGGPQARIYFDHDSDAVDSEGQGAIAGLINRFRGGSNTLSVEGHASVKANFADEVQRKIVNLRVSMNRAVAVAKELISGGVPAENIRTVAWGDSHPPLAVDGKDAEEAARRVEVYAAHQ